MISIQELLKIKFPEITFIRDVELSDYGNGPVINKWNLEYPKPTKKDLDNWAIEFDLAYRQKVARESRKYPSIESQLDMQYHDKINNTTTWEDCIAAIKEANPIPTE